MSRPKQEIIGSSPAFLTVLEQTSRLASVNRPVLIAGERGTGKELIAERLHYLSPRWSQAFIKLDCAALPESLLESELFGHEAGSFTGADRKRRGRFELADDGSLFLDELANTPTSVQEKLLRVIEYGQFERLGGSQTVHVDVRLIAATNRDLPAMAARGEFRADLLDRLAFEVITLPPLRERQVDILELAEHFAVRMTSELNRELFAGFSDAVSQQLLEYAWPGNIRELKNVIERAVALQEASSKPISSIVFDPFDSPWRLRETHGDATNENELSLPLNLPERVSAMEIRLLHAALDQSQFHQQKAADLLGLSYHQLRGLLRKYAIAGKQQRADD
ncbi:MAG: phage shock protein operon transcriptional activator [Gammaproteobacteria bacterium]|jgi:psp operon transcriptional activator|nr:phage shock protein operon transcriptional activator [Gammaproteobacteria bacterium]